MSSVVPISRSVAMHDSVALHDAAAPFLENPPEPVALASPRLLPADALEDPSAGRRIGRTRRQLPPALRRLVGPITLVVVWQSLVSFGVVDAGSLASPVQVASAAAELWAGGTLQAHLLTSLGRVGLGLAIGVSAGLLLATTAGFSRFGRDLIDSSVNMVRMIPIVALLPLIILWLGIGEPAKVFLIAVGTLFPIYMNTFAAIRGVDQKLVDAGRAFGLGSWGLIRRVILPGSVAGFLVGLRWALGAAWLLLFFAEQINAERGVGYLVNQAQGWNRTDIIMMGVALYGLLGLTSDALVRLLERWLLAWRQGFEGA